MNSLIFGIRPVMEAAESGKEFERVFIQSNLQSPLAKELQHLLRELDVPVQYAPSEKLNRLTRKNHQGVVAYISEIKYHKVENILPPLYEQGRTPLLIMLDEITDVRNLGAIIRTAECAGADAIIVPRKGSAQINAETMKASAGALNLLPVCREDNLVTTLRFLKSSGLKAFGCTEKATVTYSTADFTLPAVIVFGSEGKGIEPALIQQCDGLISIPLLGKIASLNVSVSAGIILYETVRQRAKG